MSGGTALFGSSNARSQNKNLVEFKAGKMTQKGKLVHPDTRKGLLYVYQCKDSLMHFCWKDRQTGTIEDDLIIFPDDCEFKRVPQCTTGRVYVLKFKSSNKRFFFWVQEPKTDKDDDNCRRLNEVLNNPPTPGSQRSGGVTPDGDIHNLLNNMSQQQLMQLIGGVGQMGGLSSLLGNLSGPSTSHNSRIGTGSSSSTTTTAATTAASATAAASDDTPSTPVSSKGSSKTTSASSAGGSSKDASQNQIQLSDVRSFLSGLNIPATSEEVDLSSALTVDSLQAMLGNPTVVQELQQHLPPLDETGSQQEQLRATLASPQFQQAVSMFSTALQSGQLGPVVQQFQVGDDAVQAANRGNMEDFVRALQRTSISGTPTSPTPSGNAAGAAAAAATPATPATPAATATPATPATPSAERSPSEPVHPEKKKKMDEKTPSGPPKKDDDEDEGMSMD